MSGTDTKEDKKPGEKEGGFKETIWGFITGAFGYVKSWLPTGSDKTLTDNKTTILDTIMNYLATSSPLLATLLGITPQETPKSEKEKIALRKEQIDLEMAELKLKQLKGEAPTPGANAPDEADASATTGDEGGGPPARTATDTPVKIAPARQAHTVVPNVNSPVAPAASASLAANTPTGEAPTLSQRVVNYMNEKINGFAPTLNWFGFKGFEFAAQTAQQGTAPADELAQQIQILAGPRPAGALTNLHFNRAAIVKTEAVETAGSASVKPDAPATQIAAARLGPPVTTQ